MTLIVMVALQNIYHTTKVYNLETEESHNQAPNSHHREEGMELLMPKGERQIGRESSG